MLAAALTHAGSHPTHAPTRSNQTLSKRPSSNVSSPLLQYCKSPFKKGSPFCGAPPRIRIGSGVRRFLLQRIASNMSRTCRAIRAFAAFVRPHPVFLLFKRRCIDRSGHQKQSILVRGKAHQGSHMTSLNILSTKKRHIAANFCHTMYCTAVYALDGASPIADISFISCCCSHSFIDLINSCTSIKDFGNSGTLFCTFCIILHHPARLDCEHHENTRDKSDGSRPWVRRRCVAIHCAMQASRIVGLG